MRSEKKRTKKTRIEVAEGSAKIDFGRHEDGLSELNGALKRLYRSPDLAEFFKTTNWKQRCTLLFELIYQHSGGRETAEELIRQDVINYVAVEVTEDFKEVFEAIQKKYPRLHLSSTVHGYLIHLQSLIREETDFEYPEEILYIAGTMIIGKLNGIMD
jgi:hypothetical protein